MPHPGGVIALDLATVTGWAVWRPAGSVAYGSRRLGRAGDADGAFFAGYHSWLADMITVEQPAAIVFEAPWVGPDTHQQTARRLMGLAVVTELVAHLREIPRVREVNVASVRKHFVGNGRGERAAMKRAVIEGCRQRGWDPKDDNAADALAVLDFALHCFRVPGAPATPLLARPA